MPEGSDLTHEQGLHHQLTAGQMAMVALGGSIGTGLLLGSANAISLAGPSVILSFLLAGFITFTVAGALGELACAHPAAGSFGVYGDLYLNDWAGFLSRGGYWASIAVSIGSEMVASAVYMAFWFPSVPALVWVATFSLLLLLVNLLDVGDYGRFEFWFAMVNRGVLAMPYWWDEQWTISVQHSEADIDKHLAVFEEVAPGLAKTQQERGRKFVGAAGD